MGNMDVKKYELTDAQKNIWNIEQFYPNSTINSIVGYLRINVKTDFKKLEQAFNYFVEHNDAFRFKLSFSNSGIMQELTDFSYFNIDIIECEESEIEILSNNFSKETFNVLEDKLFKVKFLKLPNNHSVVLLNIHHLISDAWTMILCLNEVYDNYVRLTSNEKISPELKPSYIDYISSCKEYISSNKYLKDKQYWENLYSTLPDLISFKKNDISSITSNRISYTIDSSLSQKISELCNSQKISDFIFWFSVFSVYFKIIFNTNKFVIGNPVLNRANFKEKQTCGIYTAIEPFVVDIPENITFLELCKKISIDQKDMYRHLKYPVQEFKNYIRNKYKNINTLYDIVFSYQNSKAIKENDSIPYTIKWLSNFSQIESLMIHLKDTEGFGNLLFNYDYLVDVFSKEDINEMHNHIIFLANHIISCPDIKIDDIDILSSEETEHYINVLNNTSKKYNKYSNVVKEFEKQVEKNPNNIAVSYKDAFLTYSELNEKANFLAKKILDLNINSNIISFELNRSIDMIIAILAILKSGHTYMPIDPNYPIDRINYMLSNSGTKLLITSKDLSSEINFSNDILFFEDLSFDKKIDNLNIEINYDSIIYTMYTSGSTGLPKSVNIMHYNVLNFVDSMKYYLDYSSNKDNKVLSVTTVCFDIFVFEVFPTLLSGLQLVIADELESKTPKLLSELIIKENISKILTTPSRLQLLFVDTEYTKCLKCLKEIILGGEPFPKQLLCNLKKLTSARIFNLYGPTETTVYSAIKELTNSAEITIGHPIFNTKIYVLNEKNKILPTNTIGELCISGDGVGAGYNDSNKTSKVFINNPYEKDSILYKTGDLGYWNDNNELVCIGRKDFQVKIHGYRIELDDISNNIILFGGISKCIAAIKKDMLGKDVLCAYYISEEPIDISKLKEFLSTKLPHYMIPSYFIRLSSFPLTTNHKIDRKALPAPIKEEFLDNYSKPNTETEKLLCSIFESELNIKNIGIYRDIFDFGIDSLDIIRVQTKLLYYNYKINTQYFYKYRTINKLAEFIDTNKNEEKTCTSSINKDLLTINNSFNKHKSVLAPKTKQNLKNILLTGVTGYLGIHILNNLLENTSAKIYCMLRNKHLINVNERIEKLYDFYFHKKINKDRVFVIDSDITSEHFGIEENFLENLGNNIDLVINSAANVRYYGEYSKFKKINIDLPNNLILFCLKYDIQLVHISTLGVSGNYLVHNENNNKSFTEDDFYIGQQYMDNIYIQTKFEAEKLIYSYIDKGLKASIIRIGNLTGRYSDGQFQKNMDENAFYNILRLILKYEIIPSSSTKQAMEFTPVDLCADALVKLLYNFDTNKYVFHLFNENYLTVSKFIEILKHLGYNISIENNINFSNIIMKSSQNDNGFSLKGLVNDIDFEKGVSFENTVSQLNKFTNSYLKDIGFKWPNIDFNYINNIINYMKRNNYI